VCAWMVLTGLDRYGGLGRGKKKSEYVARRTRWDSSLACVLLALVLVCIFFL
jgi:hypothetical protein